MDENPFDKRRRDDPQGLIDDLLKQTSDQAQGIHKLTKENVKLKEELKNTDQMFNMALDKAVDERIKQKVFPACQVGLGVLIVKDKKVLMGRRIGNYAGGLFSLPGGHLEFNEDWEACAIREVQEECGDELKIKLRHYDEHRLEFFVSNDILTKFEKHYITIYLVADYVSGEPINAEPTKCEGWAWYNYDGLKELADKQQMAWLPVNQIENYKERIGI